MNMFEVTTLGQPFEVIKTQMASNRTQTMYHALRTVWNRGGVLGFYQGLIPWAWIEASTKGAVLLFTSTEVQKVAKSLGMGPGAAGLLGGMTGGIVKNVLGRHGRLVEVPARYTVHGLYASVHSRDKRRDYPGPSSLSSAIRPTHRTPANGGAL